MYEQFPTADVHTARGSEGTLHWQTWQNEIESSGWLPAALQPEQKQSNRRLPLNKQPQQQPGHCEWTATVPDSVAVGTSGSVSSPCDSKQSQTQKRAEPSHYLDWWVRSGQDTANDQQAETPKYVRAEK